MHELSAVEDMVEIALEKAEEAGSQRITGMHFVINAGGHVNEESVRICFQIAAKDTPAQDAAHYFAWNPAHYRCTGGKHVFEQMPEEAESPEGIVTCPECGEPALLVPPVPEFYLDSIDVE